MMPLLQAARLHVRVQAQRELMVAVIRGARLIERDSHSTLLFVMARLSHLSMARTMRPYKSPSLCSY